MAREKRQKTPKVAKQKQAPEAKGSTWTHGRQLGGMVVSGVLFTAIACGPIALLVTSMQPAPVAASSTQAQTAGLNVREQTAGDYALGFVGSWLGATKKEPGDLGTYVDLGSLRQMSEQRWEYRDLGVVSITPIAGTSFVNVVVAANVKELSVSDAAEESTTAWPRRYYQVAIAVGSDALRAVGLPAQIAAPQQGSATALVYNQLVSGSDPAAETVSAFLGAYLAGSGELSRYTSPGTDIAPITPAPYVDAKVDELRADVMPKGSPDDGDTVRVLATVALLSPLEQQLTSTYSLTLTARASRWEVSAIDLAPQAAPGKESNTPTPTPTPSGAGN